MRFKVRIAQSLVFAICVAARAAEVDDLQGYLCGAKARTNVIDDKELPQYLEACVTRIRTTCVKPEPGNYAGACQALGSKGLSSSTYSLDRWISCIDEKRDGPDGGSGDGHFFSAFIPSWRFEVAANLKRLRLKLGEAQRSKLDRQQEAWIAQSRREARLIQKEFNEPGTMYYMMRSMSLMGIPRKRALELGCQIEKGRASD
jgi:Lysozyme inhibitor LprI